MLVRNVSIWRKYFEVNRKGFDKCELDACKKVKEIQILPTKHEMGNVAEYFEESRVLRCILKVLSILYSLVFFRKMLV